MNPKLWREDAHGLFPNLNQLMYEMGGGSPSPPPPPPDHTLELEAMRNEREDKQRASDARSKAEADALARQRFEENLGRSMSAANDYQTSRLSELGIDDTYGLGSAYQRELSSARAQVPDLSTDIGSILNPTNIWDKAYGSVRDTERKKLQRQADQRFGTGFENTLIADTADDSLINSILESQYTDALADLDRSKARGQLNDTAYTYAQRGLNTKKSAAANKLQDIGLGVLGNYRKTLTTEADNARNRIQNFDLGDKIDVGGLYQGLYDKAVSSMGRLEGDLRGAIGDAPLFDVDALIGSAAGKGGDMNGGSGISMPTTSLAAAFTNPTAANRNTEVDPNKKTLSNTGVF